MSVTAHAPVDEHAHDHGHHHHKETFITKYIFSQDHKMISKQYLITGLIMGFIGIAMSLLFRMQLAWPGESFPILETLLGKWAPDRGNGRRHLSGPCNHPRHNHGVFCIDGWSEWYLQ